MIYTATGEEAMDALLDASIVQPGYDVTGHVFHSLLHSWLGDIVVVAVYVCSEGIGRALPERANGLLGGTFMVVPGSRLVLYLRQQDIQCGIQSPVPGDGIIIVLQSSQSDLVVAVADVPTIIPIGEPASPNASSWQNLKMASRTSGLW